MHVFIIRKKQLIRFAMVFLLLMISLVYSQYSDSKAIGVFTRASKELPIYSVDIPDKKIAISFDAAWGAEKTPEILDILDRYEIKSTFFLVGFWVDKYPDGVKLIDKKGHEIGNHSTNHPDMSKLSRDQMRMELKTTTDKIKALTDKDVTLFRPPYGAYSDLLIQTCREDGYYVIQWDVDSLDWKEYGVEPMVQRVTSRVKPGSIVLFHNNAKYITQALPLIIEKVKAEGYEIVPISQLIYKKDFIIDHTGKQKKVDNSEAS